MFAQLRVEITAVNDARAGDDGDGDGENESDGDGDGDNENADGETAGDDALIFALAEELMRDFDGTPYAAHAAFALAKFAYESGDAARAEESLAWAVENSRDENMRHIARLRLTALLLADERAAEAADLLQAHAPPAFAARYDELRGDAAFQQGNVDDARAHWQQALDAMQRNDPLRALLQLKLNNLTLGG